MLFLGIVSFQNYSDGNFYQIETVIKKHCQSLKKLRYPIPWLPQIFKNILGLNI